MLLSVFQIALSLLLSAFVRYLHHGLDKLVIDTYLGHVDEVFLFGNTVLFLSEKTRHYSHSVTWSPLHGIEPATRCLQSSSSTTELQRP